MNVGSLFSGVGGFDLGFERAGFEIAWQVENDKFCERALEHHWPNVRRWDDVRTFPPSDPEQWRVDIIIGGDPCPKHSRARSNHQTKHPDMSGYFLALVGRLRPRWVVRENVLAPTVFDFEAALDAIGYGTIVVELNAQKFTGQSRKRHFVIGHLGTDPEKLWASFCPLDPWFDPETREGQKGFRCICATSHDKRNAYNDNFIWTGSGIRNLTIDEIRKLSGFPADWLTGISSSMCRRLYGNAVVPACAQWIAERIRDSYESDS